MNISTLKNIKIYLIILLISFFVLEAVAIVTSDSVALIIFKTMALLMIACIVFCIIYYSPQKVCQEIKNNKWVVLIAIICLGVTVKTAMNCFGMHDISTIIGQYNLIFQSIMIPCVILGLLGIYVWKLKIWQLYLLIGICVGLGMMMVIPIGGVPDETAHINTAYRLSNTILGISNSEGRVTMRMDDMLHSLQGYGMNNYADASGFENYLFQLLMPLKDETLIESATFLIPQEYSYTFAALGIALGRALGLGTYAVLMLGRLFNFGIFMLLSTYAIAIIPIGKLAMMVLMLMPMSMQQDMSYSYDVFVNGLSMLAIAFSVRIALNQGKILLNKKETVIVAIVSICLFFLKGKAYFLISLMPWVLIMCKKYPLSDKIKKRIKRIILISAVCIVIGFIIWGLTGASHFSYKPSELSFNGTADIPVAGYSVSYFIAHPFEIFSVLNNTIQNYSRFYTVTFVGKLLGWLNIDLPLSIVIIFYILLFFSSVKRIHTDQVIHHNVKLVFLIVGVLTIGFIFAGMLISWSPIANQCIQGVQGRYLIPTAMLFLLLLHSDYLQIDKCADTPIKVITLITIFYTVEFLMMRY